MRKPLANGVRMSFTNLPIFVQMSLGMGKQSLLNDNSFDVIAVILFPPNINVF